MPNLQIYYQNSVFSPTKQNKGRGRKDDTKVLLAEWEEI
jgi:hypothetical protein